MKNKNKKSVSILLILVLCISMVGIKPGQALAADDAGIRSFVTRMYEVCLGRTPEQEGLDDWSNRLSSGQAKGSDIAFGFIFSEEFQNKNLCNSHYVDALYRSFFGREADDTGKADWVGKLDAGVTRGAVMTGFVNSQEFSNLCNSYGIEQGIGDWSGDNMTVTGNCEQCTKSGNTGNQNVDREKIRAFVERLYTECLGRKAEKQGLEYWTDALVNGMTGSEVAYGFVFSDEYKMRNTSDRQFVTMLYHTILDREPDTSVVDWVYKMELYGLSRKGVFNGFMQSEEFSNLCTQSGIVPGERVFDDDPENTDHTHVYESPVILKAPTDNSDGTMKYTCNVCGKTIVREYGKEQIFTCKYVDDPKTKYGYWDEEAVQKILDSINEYRRSKGKSELTLNSEIQAYAKQAAENVTFGSYDFDVRTSYGKQVFYINAVDGAACSADDFFDHYVLTPGNDGICNAAFFEEDNIEVGIAYFQEIKYRSFETDTYHPTYTKDYREQSGNSSVAVCLYK